MKMQVALFSLVFVVSGAVGQSTGSVELDGVISGLETLVSSMEQSIQVYNYQFNETTQAASELSLQNVQDMNLQIESAVNDSGVDRESAWVQELLRTGQLIINETVATTDQCIQSRSLCLNDCLTNLGEVCSEVVSLIARARDEARKCNGGRSFIVALCLTQAAVNIALEEAPLSLNAAGLVARINILLGRPSGRLNESLSNCVVDNFTIGNNRIQEEVIDKLVAT